MSISGNVSSVNFDAKKLSEGELGEALALIRRRLNRLENQKFVAGKRGLNTAKFDSQIKIFIH